MEKTVAVLEAGSGASAYSTGVAAMTVLTELFTPGGHIIASGDLYGESAKPY